MTVTVKMNPNVNYNLEWWNTYDGSKTSQTQTSDSSGNLQLAINNLGKDLAVQITPVGNIEPTNTPTPSRVPGIPGDANGDSQVNTLDISLILNVYGRPSSSDLQADLNDDGKVNMIDAVMVINNWEPTAIPTVEPGPGPGPTASEWTQQAHDAQRTGYTSEVPAEPWTFAWAWNGPDAEGKESKNFFSSSPDPNDPIPIHDAYSVTGGSHLFIPEGKHGLYALPKAINGKVFRGEGDQDWKINNDQGTSLSFDSTPAYENGYVYAASSNGWVLKIKDNGSSYSVEGRYQTGSGITKPILLAGDSIYVVTVGGQLFRLRRSDMTAVWPNPYNAGSEAVIPAAYSASHDLIIFATRDLFVHAVKNSNGNQVWKTKPTVHTASEHCGLYQYDYRWPVIADQHGIVFIKLRVPWDGDSSPTTNSGIKSYLNANPDKQNLFALSLDDGSLMFTPAVGPTGSDHCPYCTGNVGTDVFHAIANPPIVRVLSNGKEIVYTVWRNGQTQYDPRWDSFMGEMVLDNATVPGLVAGDLRFINFASQISPNMISDEIHTLSMAGNTLFHNHIVSVDAYTINNPLDTSRGFSSSDPLPTTRNPIIVRNWDQYLSNPNLQTHYCSGGGIASGARYYQCPGFWIYQGGLSKDMIGNPYITSSSYGSGIGNEEGSVTRYTYVSNGLIIIHGGPRGDLFVLKHSN